MFLIIFMENNITPMKGKIIYLLIFLFSFLNHSNSFGQVYPKTKNLYFEIIDSLRTNKIFEEKHIKNVEDILKSKNFELNTIEKIKFNNFLAYYHLINLDLEKCNKYCQTNLALKLKTDKEKEHIGYSYYYLANSYSNQSVNKLAFENCNKAIVIFEKYKNLDGLSRSKMILANIYFYSKNYLDAIKTIDVAIKSLPKKDNLYYMLVLTKVKFLKAINTKDAEKLNKEIFLELNNNTTIDKSYIIGANIFYISDLIDKQNLTEAKKVIEITRPIIYKFNTIRTNDLFNWVLADYDFANKSPLSNRKYFLDRLEISKKENDYQTLINIYQYLKNDAFYRNNIDDLFKFSDNYNQANLNLSNEKTKSEILELKTKYDVEKKEQLIKLNSLQIDKKNKLILILSLSAIGIVFFSLFLFTLFKNKRDQKEKILITSFTHQLFENIEEERKRISSDLHDNINHELLALKYISNDEQSNKIEQIINEIRDISRNLHPIMFEKIGLENSLTNLMSRLQDHNNFVISYEIDYKNHLTKQQEIQVFRIIQECLTNTIKHANAHAAKLTLQESEKSIQIEIKDNGTGFNVTEKLNNGKSFGLSSIIERCKAIKAEYKINSSNQGTVINIEINK